MPDHSIQILIFMYFFFDVLFLILILIESFGYFSMFLFNGWTTLRVRLSFFMSLKVEIFIFKYFFLFLLSWAMLMLTLMLIFMLTLMLTFMLPLLLTFMLNSMLTLNLTLTLNGNIAILIMTINNPQMWNLIKQLLPIKIRLSNPIASNLQLFQIRQLPQHGYFLNRFQPILINHQMTYMTIF